MSGAEGSEAGVVVQLTFGCAGDVWVVTGNRTPVFLLKTIPVNGEWGGGAGATGAWVLVSDYVRSPIWSEIPKLRNPEVSVSFGNS